MKVSEIQGLQDEYKKTQTMEYINTAAFLHVVKSIHDLITELIIKGDNRKVECNLQTYNEVVLDRVVNHFKGNGWVCYLKTVEENRYPITVIVVKLPKTSLVNL